MDDRKHAPGEALKYGVLGGNPLLRLGLGLCPALAVTVTAMNGLGMGLATACVLLCTSLTVSTLRGLVAGRARVPLFLLVSAVFAAVAQMILAGWFPALNGALGVFVPLIAVNCLILNRADEAASRSGLMTAAADAVGMGLGYTAALTLVGALRELIGRGSVFGAAILPSGYEPMLLAAMPAGGFLMVGLLMGVFRAVASGRSGKKESERT